MSALIRIKLLLLLSLAINSCTQAGHAEKVDDPKEEELIDPDKKTFRRIKFGKQFLYLPDDMYLSPNDPYRGKIFKRFKGELQVECATYAVRGMNANSFDQLAQNLRSRFRSVISDSVQNTSYRKTASSRLSISGIKYGIPGERFMELRTFQKEDSLRVLIVHGLLSEKDEKEVKTILTNFW
jgi:hypothetical protein